MANFDKAYSIVAANEGGYNPGIKEAETAFGVDRGQNPKWSGWAIVDSLKPCSVATMNALLKANPAFINKVKTFFKSNYWDLLQLDKVHDQSVANNLFDCAINEGEGIAAKFMQRAAGVTVDGVIGDKTISAINNGDAETLYYAINALRKARYEATKGYAEWGPTWLKRLVAYS